MVPEDHSRVFLISLPPSIIRITWNCAEHSKGFFSKPFVLVSHGWDGELGAPWAAKLPGAIPGENWIFILDFPAGICLWMCLGFL